MAGETSAKSGVLTRVKNYLSRFSLSRKIFMGAVILLGIVGIILIINIVTAFNYGVLFSNLSAKDAGLIIDHLKANKIPYELSAGGSVVRVPEDRIAELRVRLAAAGLPAGGGPVSTTDFFTGIYASQSAYREKLETGLSREVISVLEPHVGKGKVRASVKLKLNFDKEESTEETVDPNTVTKVSERSETTSSTGAPGAAGGEAAAAKSKSEKTSVNYEVSKKVTRLTKPVGDIRRLSVAVLVDDAENVRVRDGQLIREPRSRTPEELEAIKKIVQAAVGFNSQRGDVIEVANLPFDTSAETVSEYYLEKQESRDRTNEIIIYAAVGAGLLLLYLFFIRPLYRKFREIVKQGKVPKAAEIEIPRLDSEKMAALEEARDKAEIEKELLEKYKVPRSTRKMSVIREKVKRFAEENVDETAALVKSFLIED
jgi:flagellar M-ring protein FliF